MRAEGRLELLVRAGVDAEVRDVALPAGFAERVVAGRVRRARRRYFSVALAGLATAAAAGVAPLVVPRLQPPPDRTAIAGPADLTDRIAVTNLPRGMLAGVRDPEGRSTGFVEVPNRPRPDGPRFRSWDAIFFVRDASDRRIAVSVYTGNLPVGEVARNKNIPRPGEPMEPVAVPSGQAWTRSNGNRYLEKTWVVWQRRPDLTVVVLGLGVPLDQVVAVAKGVVIR